MSQQQIVCIKRTLADKWWLNLYLANHIRKMCEPGDVGWYKFFYLLINLSQRAKNIGSSYYMEIDETMKKILEVSPIADKIKDDHIYFPLNNFTIRSNLHENKTIKIKVQLIKDKEGKLIGLDFWTSPWFWCLFSSLNLEKTTLIFRETISEISGYRELNEHIKNILEGNEAKKVTELRGNGRSERPEYAPETIPIRTTDTKFSVNGNEESQQWTPPSASNLRANLSNLTGNIIKKKK